MDIHSTLIHLVIYKEYMILRCSFIFLGGFLPLKYIWMVLLFSCYRSVIFGSKPCPFMNRYFHIIKGIDSSKTTIYDSIDLLLFIFLSLIYLWHLPTLLLVTRLCGFLDLGVNQNLRRIANVSYLNFPLTVTFLCQLYILVTTTLVKFYSSFTYQVP